MNFSSFLTVSLLIFSFGYAASNLNSSDNCCCPGTRKLQFWEKTGSNAVLTNYGRTATKIDDTQYWFGGLVTDRPLNDGELFEVLIESTSSLGYYILIGVTLQRPFYIEDTFFVGEKGNGTWCLENTNIHLDGEEISNGYPVDTADLKVGDRIGIMRKSNTNVHVYLNGVDMGVMAKYVPGPVYGTFDLCNYVQQVRIIG